ncbi:hypothetical protein EAN99_27450 [Klebsiella pneumoniae]|nr:hypothetical protein EAN99_27450 [Klebsiella pneumoniae]
MCAGGSAHEMWQGVMRFIMQSNALKPFKKESKRIIRCRNQKENKTSFQIMDKTRNKTGTLCKIYATHFSSPAMKRVKEMDYFAIVSR